MNYLKVGFSNADNNHNGSLSEYEYATHKSAVQQKETKQTSRYSAITSKVKTKYLLKKKL